MRRVSLSVLLALLAACGGDTTGPSLAEVGGTWRFTWTNLSGSGVACNASMDVQLTQSGATFSGVQTGAGSLLCLADGAAFEETITGETITAGTVTGNAVSFRLGSVQSTHDGTVSGTSMNGTASWTFDLGGNLSVTLTGQWSAVKL